MRGRASRGQATGSWSGLGYGPPIKSFRCLATKLPPRYAAASSLVYTPHKQRGITRIGFGSGRASRGQATGTWSWAAFEVAQGLGHEVAAAVCAGGRLEVKPRGLGHGPPMKSFRRTRGCCRWRHGTRRRNVLLVLAYQPAGPHVPGGAHVFRRRGEAPRCVRGHHGVLVMAHESLMLGADPRCVRGHHGVFGHGARVIDVGRGPAVRAWAPRGRRGSRWRCVKRGKKGCSIGGELRWCTEVDDCAEVLKC
jgi:hypothetical protein